MNIKELMLRRQEIAFALIEATANECYELQDELSEIEIQLEELSGESIDDLEEKFNNGEL